MNIRTTFVASNRHSYTRILELVLILLVLSTSFAMSIPTLNLRSTSNFVILAGASVTAVPPTNITGDVGLSPAAGSNIAGFDGSNVSGILYVVDASGPSGSVVNATLLQAAKSDLTIAYNDAAGRTPVPTGTFLNPGSGNMGGLTLVAGLYKFTSDAAITGSNLTLTGSASDVWIFQIGSSLNLGSGISIILAGGAQASNIFWQVGTSATLGTYSVFKGTILADQSITLGTGATINGRALAFSGAVTMASGVTSNISGTGTTGPIFSVNFNQLAFGNVINGLNKRDSVTVTNTGTADLIISSITSSNSVFVVSPLNGTITPGSAKKFYVTFSPLANGLQNGKIYFNHNGTNLKDSIQVSGTGTANANMPVFSVNPLSLDFGNRTIGTIKTDSVTVTNTGLANLIISSISISNIYYSINPATATIAPGSTRKFYVSFAPIIAGSQNGSITFNHNASNSKDSIRVTGNAVGSGQTPMFSVTSRSLDFGSVFIGVGKQKNVIVSNTGTANLIISSVISTNNHFTVTPVQGTLSPGGTQEFIITFTPTVTGQVNAKIIFTHNAGIDTITVTGNGLANNPVITINEARLLPIGTEFVIEGIVTRTMGDYTRLQDATGGLTIIQRFGSFYLDVDNHDIAMGDKIRIQGRISEVGFLKVIDGVNLTGYQRLSRQNLMPTPAKVTLSELVTNGEKYESMLITLDQMTVSSGSDIMFLEAKSYQTIDDSDSSHLVVIRIGNSKDTEIDGMPFIGLSVKFVGVLGQSSPTNPLSGYQLTPILSTDLSTQTGVDDPEHQIILNDNYPNPFNSSTTIQYSLENSDFVSLKIYDVLGKEIAKLVNSIQEAGSYNVTFRSDGNNILLENGVYFYTMTVGKFVSTKQMIFIK